MSDGRGGPVEGKPTIVAHQTDQFASCWSRDILAVAGYRGLSVVARESIDMKTRNMTFLAIGSTKGNAQFPIASDTKSLSGSLAEGDEGRDVLHGWW